MTRKVAGEYNKKTPTVIRTADNKSKEETPPTTDRTGNNTMCYKSPGPRCSGHTKAILDEAETALAKLTRQQGQADRAIRQAISKKDTDIAFGLMEGKKNNIDPFVADATAAVARARHAYEGSPAGIRELRLANKHAEADKRQKERDAAKAALAATEAKGTEEAAYEEWENRLLDSSLEDREQLITEGPVPPALLDSIARGNSNLIYSHSEHGYQVAVAQNPNASMETLGYLARHEDEEVSSLAHNSIETKLREKEQAEREAKGEETADRYRDFDKYELISEWNGHLHDVRPDSIREHAFQVAHTAGVVSIWGYVDFSDDNGDLQTINFDVAVEAEGDGVVRYEEKTSW